MLTNTKSAGALVTAGAGAGVLGISATSSVVAVPSVTGCSVADVSDTLVITFSAVVL